MDRYNHRNVAPMFTEENIPIIEKLANEMKDGFMICQEDYEGELLFVSENAVKMMGCTSLEEFKEFTGNRVQGMIIPEDFKAVQKSVDMQISIGNGTYYNEYRIIRKDGETRWFEEYGNLVKSANYGNVSCMFLKDVTERLKENTKNVDPEGISISEIYNISNLYGDAILYDSVAFFEVNLDTDEIVYANEAAFSKTSALLHNMGLSACRFYSELVEKWTRRMNQDDVESYDGFFDTKRLIRCLEQGRNVQTYDTWQVDSKGRKRMCHYILLLRKDPATGKHFMLTIAKDITEPAEREMLLINAIMRQNENEYVDPELLSILPALNRIIEFAAMAKEHKNEPERLDAFLDGIAKSGQEVLDKLRNK